MFKYSRLGHQHTPLPLAINRMATFNGHIIRCWQIFSHEKPCTLKTHQLGKIKLRKRGKLGVLAVQGIFYGHEKDFLDTTVGNNRWSSIT